MKKLEKQISELQKRVKAITELDDVFRGKGADAIRSFYQEMHLPFLLFLEGAVADYQEVLQSMEKALQSFEPAEDGYIQEEFLQGDTEDGLQNAQQTTMRLTDEANAIIDSVRDIVSLPRLDDSDYVQATSYGLKKVDDTIEKLHDFDTSQVAALESVEKDLATMKQYIDNMQGRFTSGKLVSSYSVRQLSGIPSYDKLLNGLVKKAGDNAISRDNLLAYGAKTLLSHFFKVPIPEAMVTYIHEKFGMRTMDYSYRAMKTFLDAHSSSISEAEFKTLQDKVINAEEVADYKGEFQGKYLTLSDGRLVREYVENGKAHYAFVDAIPKDRLKPVEEPSAWDNFVSGTKNVLQTTGSSIKGFGIGAYDVGKDTVVGVYDLVTDPIGTAQALGNMAIHPVQTYDQVKGAIVESYKRDMINGDAESRSHWVTYALGTTLTSVVSTKGAGTLTKGAATSAKAGTATVKTGAKHAVEHARNLDIARLLPYNQQYQLAGVNVPFNVVDGRNLLDQQLMKAERVIGNGSRGNKYSTSTMKHIYHGEINKRGKAVGYHHESMMGGKIIPGTEKQPDKNGVYMAKVEINGVKKVADSSFFPKEWNRVEVLKAIDEAYQTKQQIGSNKFRGMTSSGIYIDMYLNRDGSIVTAYPLHKR